MIDYSINQSRNVNKPTQTRKTMALCALLMPTLLQFGDMSCEQILAQLAAADPVRYEEHLL